MFAKNESGSRLKPNPVFKKKKTINIENDEKEKIKIIIWENFISSWVDINILNWTAIIKIRNYLTFYFIMTEFHISL